jgi:abortive infection bacteriophage resistance protein
MVYTTCDSTPQAYLKMLKLWGHFFMDGIFRKQPLSIRQQIDLLASRGLNFSDIDLASQYLEYVGYYRLSGYWRYFYINKTPEHKFKSGTDFQQVVDLYNFDRNLRLLILDPIENIEVTIRTIFSNVMVMKYGSHWIYNCEIFNNDFNHQNFTEKIKNDTKFAKKGGNDPIFASYYSKYQTPELPPSWMLTEALSIGVWSKLYSNLEHHTDQKMIAKKLNLTAPVLRSWLQVITILRNLCAHHNVLSLRKFHIIPREPKNLFTIKKFFLYPHSLCAQLAVVQYLNKITVKQSTWGTQLKKMLLTNELLSVTELGFPVLFEDDPFWS